MAKQITLLKQPHKQQQAFINCVAKEQLYGGAKRGGKSVALCMKAILLSYFFPGNRGLIARKDFTDLQDTTLNEFWQICPPELLDQSYGVGGHHKGERCIRLKTITPGISSDIIYRGLGDANDFEKAKSLTLGWFGIDEPSEVGFDVFKQLRAQLTWQLPNGKRPPYMCLLASNPEPGWVKDRYIDAKTPGCEFIPALPRENPHLPDGWELDLRNSYDAEWVEKYLDGSWDVAEGTVFPELDLAIHTVPAIDPAGMALTAAIDHATTGITAMVVCGIDVDGNVFALDEYYGKDQLVSYHARRMKELMAKYTPELTEEDKNAGRVRRKFRYVLIDPSTSARTQQGGNQLQSVAELYRAEGISVVPGWNALEAGLQRIRELLHVNPVHIHPLKGQPGSPKLFIVRKQCPNLWKEMKDLKKEILPSGTMRFVGTDHALDCLRYIINSQPKPSEFTPRDLKGTSAQDGFMKRAHSKWANKWGKPQTNSWWDNNSGGMLQ